MYENITPISMKGSTSSLFNNLDILPAKLATTGESSFRCAMYLSVHKYEVNIVQQNNASLTHRKVTAKESSSQHNTFLIDAKWCCLKDQTVLVIAHVRGFQIFDEIGNLLLFFHSTLERGVLSEGKTVFCRGIASLGNTILIGTCKGELLVVETIEKNSFKVTQTIGDAHSTPISTISAKKTSSDDDKVNIAMAHNAGSISLWKMMDEGRVKSVGKIQGKGYPCTAVCLLNDGLLAASYYTGLINIFDVATQELLAEISAHGAPITSMDCYLSSDHSILLSGAEDTFVRVWKITRKDELKITQEWYTSIKDLIICGVKFHSTDGLFGVSGYDSDEITLFMKRT